MCTTISLTAQDKSIVNGRTMEWGAFDLNTRLVVIPRGSEFVSKLSEETMGKTWKTKYGAVGFDALNKDYFMDGMNEKGLSVSMLFHPGTAEYQEYDPEKKENSLAPVDLLAFVLTTAASVDEAREVMNSVRVVPIVEKAFGDGPAPGHMIVNDISGGAIVIEYLNGKLNIFDAPLKVLTNSPSYDWHETNLRNYIGLSPFSTPDKKMVDIDFTPIGVGSGMIGLPGDFTPVSRFVRAVAWSQTARETSTGEEAMYEAFRILDNFNVPLHPSKDSSEDRAKKDGLRSSTIWTVVYDQKDLIIYYHTHNNRRIRKFDLKKISFAKNDNDNFIRIDLDTDKKQDMQELSVESFK